MKARIRYLAITARDPEALAHYYALHFGMWLLGISATHGFEVDYGVWVKGTA